jgi:hypothetical protein
VQGQIVPTPRGFISFDDTVLDKNYSFAIELVRWQYSGNEGCDQRYRRGALRVGQSRGGPILSEFSNSEIHLLTWFLRKS